ncbi:MAG: DUF4230 domain-containing protein [Lachnospiraceae bacterium]|nr:DUF4230 domain-containing protein [Lachnospiraceae bacterium]
MKRKKPLLPSLIRIMIIIAVMVGGFLAFKTIRSLKEELDTEQTQKEMMDERIREIREELGTAQEEKESLLQQIADMLVEEEYVVDAEVIQQEINSIGELATIEYKYTGLGTIDGSEYFDTFLGDITVPFSTKTIVVTMDGTIKVGITVEDIAISVNEASKTITVTLPEAGILSNELDENSLIVYNETTQIFNELTMEDSANIRQQIKESGQSNALRNGVLSLALDKTEQLVFSLIHAMPDVLNYYSVEFVRK